MLLLVYNFTVCITKQTLHHFLSRNKVRLHNTRYKHDLHLDTLLLSFMAKDMSTSKIQLIVQNKLYA